MHTQILDRSDDFRALRREWQALLSSSAQNHLYLTHEYLSTWWKYLSGSARLRVILVRDGGRILAAAPMMIRQGTLLRWPVRRLEFIGAGWGYGGFILSKRKKECLKLIMGALQRLNGWDIISLGRTVEDPDVDSSEIAGFVSPKRALHECFPGGVPYISLQMTWKAYLAERSSSFRRNIKNRSRKLNRIGEVRFQRVTRLKDAGVAATTLMAWLRTTAERSWKADTKTAISSNADVFAFYSELVERLNDIGSLDVSILWLNDRPVAYIFGATYNGEFFEIDIAFDAELSKGSPGIYLRNCLLMELFQQNYRVYDFVAYFDYKRELTSRVRQHDVHVFYRRTWYPLMLRSLRSVVRSTMPRMMTDYSDLSWGRQADAGA